MIAAVPQPSADVFLRAVAVGQHRLELAAVGGASKQLGADRGWGAGATSREPLSEYATDVPACDFFDFLFVKSDTDRVGVASQRRGQQCQLRGVDWGGYDAIEI